MCTCVCGGMELSVSCFDSPVNLFKSSIENYPKFDLLDNVSSHIVITMSLMTNHM